MTDHIVRLHDMVKIGSGAKRKIEDYHLSRYACYLVVENADPSKPVVAMGQTYFATKARKAELLEERPRIATYEQLMDQTRFLKGTAAKVVGIVRASDFSRRGINSLKLSQMLENNLSKANSILSVRVQK